MKAMILAAGLGTRLRPLTNTMPKPLLPVGGTPLILWNLLLLRRHKFRDVVINLHHLGPMIEHALGDGHRFGLRITYSREPVVLGTGGALKQVESQFSGQPMLVMNGDTLIEIDLEELADLHLSRKPVATMVLREDPEAGRWGLVEIDEAHRIQRINGNGRINPSGHVPRMFAGVHILHPRLCGDCPRRENRRTSSTPMSRRCTTRKRCWGMMPRAIGRMWARRNGTRRPSATCWMGGFAWLTGNSRPAVSPHRSHRIDAWLRKSSWSGEAVLGDGRIQIFLPDQPRQVGALQV